MTLNFIFMSLRQMLAIKFDHFMRRNARKRGTFIIRAISAHNSYFYYDFSCLTWYLLGSLN